MSQLAAKLKQNSAEQACNTKFLNLIHSSNRIEGGKNKSKLSAVPLGDFENVGLPSIYKQKIMLKARAKSQSKFAIRKDKSQDRSQTHARYNQKKALAHNVSREKISSTRKHSHHSSDRKRKSAKQINTQRFPEFVTPIKNQIFSIDTTNIDHKSKMHITKLSNHAIALQIKQSDKHLRRDIILSVQYGQIHYNVSYTNFMKLHFETYEITPKQIITRLNAWLHKFGIQSGAICTAELPNILSRKSISNHLILSQFTNYKQLYQYNLNTMPGLRYYCPWQPETGCNLAAQKITSLFRMNLDRKYTRKLRSLMRKVKIIQRQWKACVLYRKTRKRILASTASKLQQAKTLTAQLMQNWEIDKTAPKIQLHICSLCMEEFKRFTTDNLQQKQNTQLTRIFRALDPDTRIIYVTPAQLGVEVTRYYQRIFSINESTQAFRRITFISLQEEYHRFEAISDGFQYLPSATILGYSARALKKIRNIIQAQTKSIGGRVSKYIVPSHPSNQYISISAALNIPLFCSPIQSISKLYSTKSGFRQLLRPAISQQGNKSAFKLLKAVQDLYSEREIINSLAILIHKHKQVKKWYLKIDDEMESRGLAIFYIDTILFLRELSRQKDSYSEDSNGEFSDKSIIRLIANELQSKLKHRLKIQRKDIYSSYELYITHFITRGGVIEASPCTKTVNHSVSFLIEPNGDFSLLNSYSRLYSSNAGTFTGIKCPSDLSASEVDSQVIVRSLYRVIWSKHRMFGYFAADLLYESACQQTYVIGLDCFLNGKACSIFVPRLTSSATYIKQSNQLQTYPLSTAKQYTHSSLDQQCADTTKTLSPSHKQQQLHYLYCPMLKIQQLPNVSAFFSKCKYSNISFDLQRKMGTIILLTGPIESGCFGFMTIAESVDEMLAKAQKLVDFLSREYRHRGKKAHGGIGELRGVLVSWIRRQRQQINQLRSREDLDLGLIF